MVTNLLPVDAQTCDKEAAMNAKNTGKQGVSRQERARLLMLRDPLLISWFQVQVLSGAPLINHCDSTTYRVSFCPLDNPLRHVAAGILPEPAGIMLVRIHSGASEAGPNRAPLCAQRIDKPDRCGGFGMNPAFRLESLSTSLS